MIHRAFIRLFYDNLTRDAEGRYIIHWQGKPCYVDVEDTAFVIRGASFSKARDDSSSQYVLTLSDDSEEPLDPGTLYVGKENVLYCRVKKRAFPARFTRNAYYQLAQFIQEEKGNFYLPLDGKKWMIPLPPVTECPNEQRTTDDRP
jgi:hypothetical protein